MRDCAAFGELFRIRPDAVGQAEGRRLAHHLSVGRKASARSTRPPTAEGMPGSCAGGRGDARIERTTTNRFL